MEERQGTGNLILSLRQATPTFYAVSVRLNHYQLLSPACSWTFADSKEKSTRPSLLVPACHDLVESRRTRTDSTVADGAPSLTRINTFRNFDLHFMLSITGADYVNNADDVPGASTRNTVDWH